MIWHSMRTPILWSTNSKKIFLDTIFYILYIKLSQVMAIEQLYLRQTKEFLCSVVCKRVMKLIVDSDEKS